MSYQADIIAIAQSDGMPLPLSQLIAAQAAHETGNFTSPVFWDCNNAFGYTSVRSSCAGHPAYQNYASVAESVHELTGWIKRRLNEGNFPALSTITDPVQYATLLKENNYYEDSINNYAAGLARYLGTMLPGGNMAVIGLAFLMFLVIRKRH